MINVTKAELPPLKQYSAYIKKIWKSAWLTNNGTFHQKLEESLAKYLKVDNISLVTNGTLAIQLALKVLGVKGEVITTPFTFAATTTSLIWENCTPIFADIDPETYNIDPKSIEKEITDKTTAILAVHVYGNPCDVVAIEKIAKKHNLIVIYDAAHAFGVEYEGKSILNYGDASTLSFHATKVFNTIEGGAIVMRKVRNKKIADLLKNFGIVNEERVILAGINAKMNEFQAAMGLCNLPTIETKIKLRQKIYEKYNKLLSANKINFQKIVASKYNYSYMPVLVENMEIRDMIYDRMFQKGYKLRKYFYPLTCDMDLITRENLTKVNDCPIAKDISNRVLCLPLYSTLNLSEVEKIADLIKKFIE